MEQEASRGGGRKVKSLDPKIFGKATERVQELTVDDLNQLAQVANQSARPTGNVAELTSEDLRSLDNAFHEARLQAADLLARRLGGEGLSEEEEEIFNNWSCCCCTPCCCCAAADVDPFE
jgi:hypothetical protein